MRKPLDVLAIAAHPDDAEVGCGGTLIRAADAALAVGVVDLTAGELSTRGDPRTRAAERRQASDALGLSARIGLELPDGGLDCSHAQRAELVAVLRRLRPRIVLAPYPEDRHPDHAAAGRLAREACFAARVRRYEGGGDAHAPAALYHYLMHGPFRPSFVVDVTSAWARRNAAVGCYASQFAEPGDAPTALSGGSFLDVLEARSRWFGAMIGADHGEPFWSAGPLGLDALPDNGGRAGYRMFV